MMVGKVVAFGDLTIQPVQGNDRELSRVRVNYGPLRGSEIFNSETRALRALDKWSDTELTRVSKELAALTKLRRYIRRTQN
jgi:hypothetical protein